ncbi:hypothetical protein J6590_015512 [Homalodisca vitripennis]|nr:hypothetical protein J6590_015512 [Homalodisca vitripennis]
MGSSTSLKCQDSGVHGQFNRSGLLWAMTVGVGGVCSLTSEVLGSLNKGVPSPTYFDRRGWFRAGLPFFQGDMTLRCSALILPHGSRFFLMQPLLPNLTQPEYPVTPEAAQREQKEKKEEKVTVIADKFNTETTSDGAAGLFYPESNFKGPTPSSAKEWTKYSYKYYEDFLNQDCGVFEISGYVLSTISEDEVKECKSKEGANLEGCRQQQRSSALPSENLTLHHEARSNTQLTNLNYDMFGAPGLCKRIFKNDLMDGAVPEHRPATRQEMLHYLGNWKYGTFMRTLLIRCRTFLPFLIERIKSKGGHIMKKKVEDLSELKGRYDVVVNCTGLQAKFLCGDDVVAPLRGQIIKVKAPNIDRFLLTSELSYIIPNCDGLVTLGGTKQLGVWNTSISAHDSKGIMSRCTAILPELENAPVAWEWAGLRPYRQSVRLEPEIRDGLKGLCVNPTKTALVALTRGCQLEGIGPFLLKGSFIEFKSKIKYLVVVLDRVLNWGFHLDMCDRGILET